MTIRTRDAFLLAGGREAIRKGADPLLHAAFAQVGKPKPSVAYVGVASHDDNGFFGMISSYLTQAGAGEVRLAALASPHARIEDALEILRASDLVFVSGGDVEAGMQLLEARGITPALAELYDEGKTFVGVSAGSIMLAQCWVRWKDADDDTTAETFPCLGLAPVLCDTHAESDDWDELRTLLRLRGASNGYGIPSGAALRVRHDGAAQAMGKPVHRFRVRAGTVERLSDLSPVH